MKVSKAVLTALERRRQKLIKMGRDPNFDQESVSRRLDKVERLLEKLRKGGEQ